MFQPGSQGLHSSCRRCFLPEDPHTLSPASIALRIVCPPSPRADFVLLPESSHEPSLTALHYLAERGSLPLSKRPTSLTEPQCPARSLAVLGYLCPSPLDGPVLQVLHTATQETRQHERAPDTFLTGWALLQGRTTHPTLVQACHPGVTDHTPAPASTRLGLRSRRRQMSRGQGTDAAAPGWQGGPAVRRQGAGHRRRARPQALSGRPQGVAGILAVFAWSGSLPSGQLREAGLSWPLSAAQTRSVQRESRKGLVGWSNPRSAMFLVV